MCGLVRAHHEAGVCRGKKRSVAARGETGFQRALGVCGRQCSTKVNLVSLGTKEAVFANWSVTIPSSPVPARVSHLQLPMSGRAVLGTE